jgi:hypothetical protein
MHRNGALSKVWQKAFVGIAKKGGFEPMEKSISHEKEKEFLNS